MLDWVSNSVIQYNNKLTVEQLDYLHDKDSTTIGSLMLHLVATEVIYQDITFHDLQDFSAANKAKWEVPMKLEESARTQIKGNPLRYYKAAFDEVRAVTKAEMKKRDYAWLLSGETKDWDWNNYCNRTADAVVSRHGALRQSPRANGLVCQTDTQVTMRQSTWHCATLLLLFLSVGSSLRAQTVPPNLQPAKLDRFIMQLMDSARIPGLSLVLIRGNNVAYSKGYGLTKADSTQPVTPNTIFEAASLSKPVFAYAVLQLVEENLLDLDKPLYEYLPYPDAAADSRYQKITARLVLSHQSGFPNWRKDRKLPQLAMAYSPGERFGYSGEGYVYLQKVVEKITGQPINQVMEFRVLKPLGMTNSSFVWQSDFTTHIAMPHNEAGEPEQKFQPTQANMAYSLHTTAEDYARLIRATFTPTGLKPATVNQMLTPTSKLPTRFSGDTLSTNLYWGLGFGLEQMPEATYFWHWGDNGAFKCFVMANKDRQDAVIYFTNSANGLDIADRIIAQTLGGQHPAFPFLGINADDFFRKHPYKVK